MVISQGDVCWAELPEPTGSGPGFRRPVVAVQRDALNRSLLAEAVCIPLTSNLRWADAPGNVLLTAAVNRPFPRPGEHHSESMSSFSAGSVRR